MSFGWSAGDIITLSKLCYEIYSFCRNAPEEVLTLFNKVEGIGYKLERLSIILEKSGLGLWRQTPALEQNLLKVKKYLEPLRSITDKTSSAPSKAKGWARLALNKDKFRLLEKGLDVNEREIDEMKVDLIL